MKNNFSAWLIEEMEQKGLSQRDLSRLSGLSQGAISKVINGDRNPGFSFVEGVSRALNLPVEIIMEKAGLLNSSGYQSELVTEIKYKISMLPEDKLQSLLDIVDAFLVKNRAAHVAADKKEAYKTKKE